MVKVATIAGSDASGGAGLEADLKTFEEYGLYGMAAVTLVATMDPKKNWAHSVFPLDENALKAQLETVFNGVGVSAVKSGMLGTFYAVELAAGFIRAGERFGSSAICFRAFSIVSCMFILFPIPFYYTTYNWLVLGGGLNSYYHSNSFIPIKTSKNHQLTKREKAYNRRLARRHVVIEHINGDINFTPGPLSPLLFSHRGQMYKALPRSVSSKVNV